MMTSRNDKLNAVIEHIRTVCEDNAKSPNPDLVLEFIEHIVQTALRAKAV